MTAWILVAQGAACQIIEIKKGQKPTIVQELLHPATAKKGQNINTDRPGRSFDSTGRNRHAMDYGEEMKDHERRVFAKEIVNFLHLAHTEHRFERLVLVSSRNLLGDLRKALPDSLQKAVTHELDKDFLSQQYDAAQLAEKIKTALNIVAF